MLYQLQRGRIQLVQICIVLSIYLPRDDEVSCLETPSSGQLAHSLNNQAALRSELTGVQQRVTVRLYENLDPYEGRMT